MPQPTALSGDLAKLATALATSTVAVVDFETSGLKTYRDQIGGLGVYLPESDKAFYINIGHGLEHPKFPKATSADLIAALQPFASIPTNRLIAHNATFELRFFLRHGLAIQCRTSCTMIHTHRADETLREHGKERTTHYHSAVSYGLKELTTIFFGESPPSITEATGGMNVIAAEIAPVAKYCVLDCYNTWRLFQRAELLINQNPDLRKLIDDIDDPNMVVLSKMMGEGILIDVAEANAQAAIYEQAIQACRNEIWAATGLTWPLDTPKETLRVLRHLDLKTDEGLGYDPFYISLFNNDEQNSVARDVLLEIFEYLTDPNKKKIVALFIAKTLMEFRLSAFLKPLPARVGLTDGRLYPDSFSSTLTTTRFSSSPNLQNLPRKMGDEGDVDEDDIWLAAIPETIRTAFQTTKNIFISKPGHTLVSMDLSAAEPRYLALLFQRFLQEWDQHFEDKKEKLRTWRREKYGKLMKVMRETAEPFPEDEEEEEEEEPLPSPDALYKVFKFGIPVNDPYNALLIAMDPEGYKQATNAGNDKQWLKDNRWRGKRAFLALGYGSTAENLFKPLKWTLQQTEDAIRRLEETYTTLVPLRDLTLLEMMHTGEVRSLWGRPRRISGYYQLARPEPVKIGFYRMRPTRVNYEADIIPLGSTRQAVQAFVHKCYILNEDGKTGEIVLEGDPLTGALVHKSKSDVFANADHFNNPPFRNISFNQINWVIDKDGLMRTLPRQARAQRQAFNALCQSTGADHLRWLMNRMDSEVCQTQDFSDCTLILTVHDSLIYEVPDEKVMDFVAVARPIMETRPYWSDINLKVGIEVGKKYGEMEEIPPTPPPTRQTLSALAVGIIIALVLLAALLIFWVLRD